MQEIIHMTTKSTGKGESPEILDIGCGEDKVEGAVGIDIKETNDTDVVIDVEEEGLPYNDNSVSVIHARMSLEHMDAPTVIAECHRVLKSGGELHIKLPHPYTSGFWQDWTHNIQPGFTRKGIQYLDSKHHMHYEHDMGSWSVEDLHVEFWLNLESIPGRAFSVAMSILADLMSNRTREELLKLPFAGGWITADLKKQ